jgi:hypothetical protein
LTDIARLGPVDDASRACPGFSFPGYICGTDHSVPDSVSLADFAAFVAKAKSLITY